MQYKPKYAEGKKQAFNLLNLNLKHLAVMDDVTKHIRNIRNRLWQSVPPLFAFLCLLIHFLGTQWCRKIL